MLKIAAISVILSSIGLGVVSMMKSSFSSALQMLSKGKVNSSSDPCVILYVLNVSTVVVSLFQSQGIFVSGTISFVLNMA
jgi:hypothetical protein